MAIKDLQPKQGDANVIATVVSKENAREFQKFGKTGRVCNALIKDDTGEVKLTLWNEQVDMINVGDKIEIKNGYVNEWQGERQLTTGKFGKLEILGKDDPQTNATEKMNDKDKEPEKVYTNVPPKEFQRLEVEEEQMGDYDEDY